MGLIRDHVHLTIRRTGTSVTRQGFGIGMFMDGHRVFDEVIREYTGTQGMLDGGFSTLDAAYRAAVTYFAQEPSPRSLKMGRRATGTTVVVHVTQVANTRTYTVRLEGELITFTSDATATAAEIAVGLAAAINAVIDTTDAITAGASGVGFFQVNGLDLTARFVAGFRWNLNGTTSNDGNYVTLRSELVGADTRIFVQEVIAATGADVIGNVRRIASAATPSATALGAAALDLTPYLASPYYRVGGEDMLRVRTDLTASMATDLASIRAIDDAWYGLAISSRFAAEVEGAATAVEGLAAPKLFGTANSEPAARDVAPATDNPLTGSVVRRLQNLARVRTFSLWSNSGAVAPARTVGETSAADDPDFDGFSANESATDPFPEFGWMARELAKDPGRSTWKAKPISGVGRDLHTAQQRLNLMGNPGRDTSVGKQCNVYEEVAGLGFTDPGVVASGEFIDVIRDLDWLLSEMEAQVFTHLADVDKIPYTQAGLNSIAADVDAVLKRARDAGVIDSIVEIVVPLLADTTAADRAARRLRGVTFRARRQGAIHDITITGEVFA